MENAEPMFELRQYDDERVVAVMGGKEYGPPEYDLDLATLNRNSVFNDGMPIALSAIVRDANSRELVASFLTRVEWGG